MKTIEVMVSPFYRGEGFTDKGTGITFEQYMGLPRIYNVPTTCDLSGIKTLVHRKHLMLVSGTLEQVEAKEEVVEEKTEPVLSKTEPVTSGVEESIKEGGTVTTAIVQELNLEKLEEATLAELKKIAKEEGIEHKAKITRKELQELIKKEFEG